MGAWPKLRKALHCFRFFIPPQRRQGYMLADEKMKNYFIRCIELKKPLNFYVCAQGIPA